MYASRGSLNERRLQRTQQKTQEKPMKTKSTLLACISIALTCNAFAADLPPARNIP